MDKNVSVIIAAAITSVVSSFSLFLFNAFRLADDVIEKRLNIERKSVKWWALQSAYYALLLFAIGIPMQFILRQVVCKVY